MFFNPYNKAVHSNIYICLYICIYVSDRLPNGWTELAKNCLKEPLSTPGVTGLKNRNYFSQKSNFFSKSYFFSSTGNAGHLS